MLTRKTKIINNDAYKLVITREQINKRYTEIARQIKKNFPNAIKKPPILMGVVTGGLFPLIDITRKLSKINFPYKVDTIGVSRYGNNKHPGKITITKFPSGNISNEHIIIVEDVIEEGVTINYIVNLLLLNLPASIKILAMGWKKELSKLKFPVDYIGFKLKPEWLIGEGMDDEQIARGLTGIWQKIK